MRRDKRGICKVAVSVLAVIFLALTLTEPASSQKPFYKGKMVRIIVGYAPGGGGQNELR